MPNFGYCGLCAKAIFFLGSFVLDVGFANGTIIVCGSCYKKEKLNG